jgi:glycerophosphoryl diester phosphodiesterase family protein
MTVGGVLGQSFQLYQKFFWRFVATAAVVFAVLDLIPALTASVGSLDAVVLLSLIGLVTLIIGTFWVQGALTEAVHDVRDGRIDTTVAELYGRTRPRLPSLIVAGVLASIGIVIGLALLIAPGLYLLTRWVLIVPVIVIEGKSAGESFTRSSKLTEGHRWTVLGIVLVSLLIYLVVGGIVVGIFDAILPTFLGTWLGNLVAHSLFTPLLALAWTIMYFELAKPEAEPAL